MRRFGTIPPILAPLFLAAGCAGTQGPAPSSLGDMAPASLAASPADRVALALMGADEAAAAGDTARLRQSLGVLERLAATPAGEGERETLSAWRRLAPRDTPPVRGSALGPAFRRGVLEPGGRMDIGQTFLAGQRANLAVEIRGGGPLRVEVLDSSDKPVCAQSGQRARCSWLPLFSERHSIRLSNRSNSEVTYYLAIK